MPAKRDKPFMQFSFLFNVDNDGEFQRRKFNCLSVRVGYFGNRL